MGGAGGGGGTPGLDTVVALDAVLGDAMCKICLHTDLFKCLQVKYL